MKIISLLFGAFKQIYFQNICNKIGAGINPDIEIKTILLYPGSIGQHKQGQLFYNQHFIYIATSITAKV
jgi:hypothetical protein